MYDIYLLEFANISAKLAIFFEKIADFAIILELNGYSGCLEFG